MADNNLSKIGECSTVATCSPIVIFEESDDLCDRMDQEIKESLSFTPNPLIEDELRKAFDSLRLNTGVHYPDGIPPSELKLLLDRLRTEYDVGIKTKSTNNDSIFEQVKNMIYNQAVILRSGNELTHLVIPRFDIIPLEGDVKAIGYDTIQDNINSSYLLVLEHMDYDTDIRVQKKKYLDPKMNNAICELALFICETGYSDVNYTDTPIAEDGKIVLLVHSNPCNPTMGLAIRKHSYREPEDGLLGMISHGCVPKILDIAKSYNMLHRKCYDDFGFVGHYRTVYEVYLKKISTTDRNYIDIFYLNNKIKTGLEPITTEGVDFPEFKGKPITHVLESSEFRLTPEEYREQEKRQGYVVDDGVEEYVKLYVQRTNLAKDMDVYALSKYTDMRDVLLTLAQKMVDTINKLISQNIGDMSKKDRRYMCFRLNHSVPYLIEYFDTRSIQLPKAIGGSDESDPPSHGGYVLSRLKEQGHIFSYQAHPSGYFIQA